MMDGLDFELFYSTTEDGSRPSGMVPCGIWPDVIKVTHKSGVVVQLPCGGSSQHYARTVAIEMIEWALSSKRLGLEPPITTPQENPNG